MFLGGGSPNSPFPLGAVKVAVSSLYVREGDREGDMSLWYSKAPASTSQTAQAHLTLGKSLNPVALFPLWQPWSAGGKIWDNMNPAGS